MIAALDTFDEVIDLHPFGVRLLMELHDMECLLKLSQEEVQSGS